MLQRRPFMLTLGTAAAVACAPRHDSPRTPNPRTPEIPELAALEGTGRLGVARLDTATGDVIGHRLDQRFAMCSTFKLVLAAMVLQRAADGALGLDDRLILREADLVPHAPMTEPRLSEAIAAGADHAEMTMRELAHAAQTTSDNVAANVLLGALGGPAAYTAFCRAHGDAVTRLDRLEPWMNLYAADDPRDTTTPLAFATLVGRLLGDAARGLHPDARTTLRQWLIETGTGVRRVRAGLPAGWIAGDKTGTMAGDGQSNKTNDVAWIEPPDRAPLVVAAYFDAQVVADDMRAADEAVLAAVGRWAAGRLG